MHSCMQIRSFLYAMTDWPASLRTLRQSRMSIPTIHLIQYDKNRKTRRDFDIMITSHLKKATLLARWIIMTLINPSSFATQNPPPFQRRLRFVRTVNFVVTIQFVGLTKSPPCVKEGGSQQAVGRIVTTNLFCWILFFIQPLRHGDAVTPPLTQVRQEWVLTVNFVVTIQFVGSINSGRQSLTEQNTG